MNRRQFIAAAGAVAALPVMSEASAAQASTQNTLHNVVFSADDPGHWKNVEQLHVPDIAIKDRSLSVTTPHPMSEAHYIVSHTVVLENGQLLDRKTFNWHDKPVSEHILPENYKGKLRITSTCNLHDFWVKDITV